VLLIPLLSVLLVIAILVWAVRRIARFLRS